MIRTNLYISVILQIGAICLLAQFTEPQYGQWNNWNAIQNGQRSPPFYGQNNLYPRSNNPRANIASNDGSVWGSYGPNPGLFNPNPRQDFSGLYGANSGVFNVNPRFNWPNSVNQGSPTQDFFPQQRKPIPRFL